MIHHTGTTRADTGTYTPGPEDTEEATRILISYDLTRPGGDPAPDEVDPGDVLAGLLRM
jgi:hypothetical protein